MEAKVGVDDSAVSTSLDYKVKSTSSVDPGHRHTKLHHTDGTEMLTVIETGVGIGDTEPDPTALLELNSTSKGFLPPRMTSDQRDLIVSAANGLVIFNTTVNALQVRYNGSWNTLSANTVDSSYSISSGASTLTPSATGKSQVNIAMSANGTLNGPTGGVNGQRLVFKFLQDETGSRTVTLATGAGNFRFGADVTGVTLSTAASKEDYMAAIYNQNANRWDVVSFVKGY